MALTADEDQRIQEMLDLLGECKNKMNARSRDFVEDVERKFNDNELHMTPPMWKWLEGLHEQYSR